MVFNKLLRRLEVRLTKFEHFRYKTGIYFVP